MRILEMLSQEALLRQVMWLEEIARSSRPAFVCGKIKPAAVWTLCGLAPLATKAGKDIPPLPSQSWYRLGQKTMAPLKK